MRHLLIGLGLVICLFAGLTGLAYAEQSVQLSSSPSGVILLDQNDLGLTLNVQIGKIDFFPVITKGGNFTLLTIDKFTYSQRNGEPKLPMVNRILTIPFGSELQAEVVSSEYEIISLADLGIENPIMPVQPSLSKSQDPAQVPFEFNQAMYNKGGNYQLPLVETQILGTMRSQHLGQVSVAPIEYDITNKTLKVYKNIVLKIHYLHPDMGLTQKMHEEYYSPVFEPIYDGIINYQGLPAGMKADLTKYPVRYLIVSPRNFKSFLQPFIEWKTKKGFIVDTAYTDVIGSTSAAIKTWIQNKYNTLTPKPSFVLLVGDAQQIPPWPFSGHISDLSFCEFTGDNFPEIYYGRFSAQDTTQLKPQIIKTLEYEQYTMPDPSYLGEVTMVSGVDGTYAPTYGNGQINYGTTYYFNIAHGITSNTWLYPASDASGASAAIIQTVNDGIGFMNYTAHGGHEGHSDPSFSTTDVAGLTNIHKYNLTIGNCCLTNTFGTDYSTPCFGEAWLQKSNGGGIGYIGGTNSTYWDEDYFWGVGYGPVSANPTYEQTGRGAYDGVFHTHGEPMSGHYVANDALIFAGNMAVQESNSSRKAYYWQIYHLMGDPSVITYMGVPSANSVTYPATVLITDTYVTVQADPESYVGISRNGVLYGAGFIDSSGTANIPITSFGTPGTADIVVTHQNRIPFISTFMVIAPNGPYVIYDSHTINDAAGNNNGMVDIGESIVLGVQVKNVGPDDALNVVATLATSDPYVTLTDNTESYGTIAGNNGTAYSANAFAFNVSGTTPDDHKVTFDLTVNGDQRLTWNSSLNITVHAPTLNYVSVSIDDMSGNGNGILDPGETGQITVTINNTGTGAATNVTGVLSEFDSFVSISDANGTFGAINPGGTGSNAGDEFTISADPTCPMGHLLTLNLALTGDGSYAKNLTFDFTVGDRVVAFADDFSISQGWTGLGGSAEWQIDSCKGGTGGSNPDPSQDHSPSLDNRVLGNDLAGGTGGAYSANLATTYWVYSPVIDCEDYGGMQMTYFHWLGVESSTYDHAYLQVYNGNSWVQLYANGATIGETSWTGEFYDLTEYADENPSFQIRFGLGPTDGSGQYSGWNIDDIQIKGYYTGSDYKVRMLPSLQSKYGPAGDSTSYLLTIRNRGAFVDNFTLSYSGDWAVAFFDASGQNQISQTGNVGSLDSAIIMAKVVVPPDTPLHQKDSSLIFATSQGNPLVKDSAVLITYSYGVPATIPWTEIFPASTLEMQRWFSNVGGTISTDATNEPSYPYSLNLDGTVDTLVSQLINLENQTGTLLSFYYERGGGGDPTESGDNLWIEYKNSSDAWSTLAMYPGDGPVMSSFAYISLPLPADALHKGFQLRLRNFGVGNGSDDWFVDDIRIDFPPSISTAPNSLSKTLQQGESAQDRIIINNSGLGNLLYTVGLTYYWNFGGKFGELLKAGEVEAPRHAYPPEYYTYVEEKGADNPNKGADVQFKAGGPDDFGYYWMDSGDPNGPDYSWAEISATGVDIISQLDDDNYVGPLNIGFEFPFYGNTYTQFYFGSNGIIGFGSSGMSSRNNTPIPNSAAPNNIIAWLWDDLNPTDADNPSAHVYYKSDGQKLIIEIVDYPEYRADPGDVVTAEIILDKKGGIKIQYKNIATGFNANGCTVGIENASGSDGLEVVYAAAYLHNFLAIQFVKPYEWLSLSKLAGQVAPGANDTIQCTFSAAADMDTATYTADVKIFSNDPLTNPETVGAELKVQSLPQYLCGDASGDGMVNVSDAVFIINYIFVTGSPAPNPIESGDINCDGISNVSDAVYIINYVFTFGSPSPCDTNGDGIPDC